jgi:hypothetical protein
MPLRCTRSYWILAAGLGAAVTIVAGCGSSSPRAAGPGPADPAAASAAPTARSPAAPTTTVTTVPATTTTVAVQSGWTVVARTPTRIVTDERIVTEPDGAHVTLVRFHAGTYRLDLHLGSEDPPSEGLSIPAVAGDAVAQTERPALLGAFNGGFKTSSGSGGFEVDGQVVVPLVAGRASLVIDTNGTAHVGVWERGLPAPGEVVASVRQNLLPLIDGGVTSPHIGDLAAWGTTLGPGPAVARSAVGTDHSGDLVYAGSESALPADLAGALASAKVTEAMELDINPEWVQVDVASTPGGALTAALAGQSRPAVQYLDGWTRDFVAVLGTGAA